MMVNCARSRYPGNRCTNQVKVAHTADIAFCDSCASQNVHDSVEAYRGYREEGYTQQQAAQLSGLIPKA